MPRPKKVVGPKAKKIKLSKTQKQYAKMIHSIEADLEKKKASAEVLKKKIATMQEGLQKLEGETANLEGAKRNLEGILSQIPPPPQWQQFTKYVYEYHHHYHHHDCTGCKCPYPHYPVYIGPWWQYYYGGGYITYPTQSQLTGSIVNIDNAVLTSSGNIGSSLLLSARATPTPILGAGVPNNTVLFTSGENGSFVSHNSNLPGLNNVSLASSSFNAGCGPNVAFMGTMTSVSAAPVEYAPGDANITESVTALQSYGFFDMGAPAVDAGDLTVSDLAKSASK